MQRPAATSALETWKSPASGSSTRPASRRHGRRLEPRREALARGRQETDRLALGADGEDLQPAPSRTAATTCGATSLSASMTAGAPALQQLVEQAQLGGEIGVRRRVIVEMVARQIGEGAGREAHAVEPVLVEAVRGGFQREMGDAAAGELVERSVQRDRVRRRQRAIDVDARATRCRSCRAKRPRGRARSRSAA